MQASDTPTEEVSKNVEEQSPAKEEIPEAKPSLIEAEVEGSSKADAEVENDLPQNPEYENKIDIPPDSHIPEMGDIGELEENADIVEGNDNDKDREEMAAELEKIDNQPSNQDQDDASQKVNNVEISVQPENSEQPNPTEAAGTSNPGTEMKQVETPQPAQSTTEQAQTTTTTYFESHLNQLEIDYLNKLLPKGYSITTTFRTARPRTTKLSDVALSELKEDSLPARRISRPPKERFRQPDYSFGSSKFSKPSNELVKKCFRLLTLLQKHEFGQPFLKPVDHVALGIPDYPLIVKEPMDLSRVEKKLRAGAYTNPMQFATDVRKIWSNAILYNPKSSPVYDMTVVISNYFEKIFKPVEENPFQEQPNDYIAKKVKRVEKKLKELKNDESDLVFDENDPLQKVMTREEKKSLALMIKGRLLA